MINARRKYIRIRKINWSNIRNIKKKIKLGWKLIAPHIKKTQNTIFCVFWPPIFVVDLCRPPSNDHSYQVSFQLQWQWFQRRKLKRKGREATTMRRHRWTIWKPELQEIVCSGSVRSLLPLWYLQTLPTPYVAGF